MYCIPRSTAARTLLTLGALTLGLSCAGNTKRASMPEVSGHPTNITFRDYRSGIVLTLINDSMLVEMNVAGENVTLRRAAYHSQLDRPASAKVTDDVYVAGLLKAFDEWGYFGLASAGLAPERAGEASSSIEVSKDGRSQHILFSARLSRSSQEAYQDCNKLFREMHNRVAQWRSASSIPTVTTKVRGR
ncbi:MAG TPA: hypothetical protein EYQ74_08685 [Planctomycetes bacterium]|nr:hypothetical protein [Planctomycetota bacterium]HIK60872.1 hypothetical protein [Planctomycetota bacterium]